MDHETGCGGVGCSMSVSGGKADFLRTGEPEAPILLLKLLQDGNL